LRREETLLAELVCTGASGTLAEGGGEGGETGLLAFETGDTTVVLAGEIEPGSVVGGS
jgi:hypothetical protein